MKSQLVHLFLWVCDGEKKWCEGYCLIIDGIAYVADPGYSQQKIHKTGIRVESFIISPIPKAGRAGRTRPGNCFRLYTERISRRNQRRKHLLRSCNLGNTVLELVKLRINFN